MDELKWDIREDVIVHGSYWNILLKKLLIKKLYLTSYYIII